MGTTTVQEPKTLTRDEWLARRRNTLGASEVAAALGLDENKSPFALWCEKTGRIEPKDETLPMRLGHLMEPVVTELYQQETGRTVFDPGDYAVFTHPDYEWLSCTPDRLHGAGDIPENSPLEIKSMGEFSAKKYKDGDPPLHHQVQLQTQILLLDKEHGALAALVSNRAFFTFDFTRHDRLIKNMLPALERFWECVQADKEPQIDHLASTTEALRALHPDDNGETVYCDDRAQIWLDQFRDAQSQIKQLEKERDEAKNNIIALIGDATFLEGGGYRLSYKTQERKGVIKVELDYEDALAAAGIPYKVTPASKFRVLRSVKKS